MTCRDAFLRRFPQRLDHGSISLDRSVNDEIQLDLFLSYGSNPPLYPQWQEYFRTHQPPMLIVRGPPATLSKAVAEVDGRCRHAKHIRSRTGAN